MLENIPIEMRAYAQFVMWRYEETESKKPTKVPYSALTGRLASVVDPATWCSFDQAVFALRNSNWYAGIGFVLTDNDPFTFVDLDDCEGDQVKIDRQQQIYSEFESYAEVSPSGQGLHIIIKGSIPSGRRRGCIEIYSTQRYMTMTGNVFRNAPIRDFDSLAYALWEKLGEGKNLDIFYAGLEEAKTADDEILNIAGRAANSEKFNALFYDGEWQKYYPSQSEADFALVDILAFYSENRQQVQKLFLQSALAQREKSRAQYRINYMLDRCFDRMLPPIDIDGLHNQLIAVVEKNNREHAKQIKHVEPQQMPAQDLYSCPAGLVGEIAQFIYSQAPRPVAEIALAGAIGLVTGICGRAYNVSGTGLNQYVLLLAPTGTGKESIASGIDKLMTAVVKTVPAASEFIGPGKIASEQALLKYMAKGSNSFVSLVGEFGIQLKLMASPYAPPHMQGLVSMMLDLYNKSGEGKVMRPSIYSNKENNTNAVYAPAFTLIGESTPEKFYESLDESMISSGLLPRFTTIEYTGPRVKENENHMYAKPSFELIDKLAGLCSNALMLNNQNKVIHVEFETQANTLMKQFRDHCDNKMNLSDKELRRHLWNRGHVKAMKLAAIIAVGCNAFNPVITVDQATWAINVVTADIHNLLGKFDAGEIGQDNDEIKQLSRVISVIGEFTTLPWQKIETYKAGTQQMHQKGICTYSYIHKRLASVTVFKRDKRGACDAIKKAIKTLIERGDIQEVPRATLAKDFQTHAAAYMIANAKLFFPT